jgi:hypothetical protein
MMQAGLASEGVGEDRRWRPRHWTQGIQREEARTSCPGECDGPSKGQIRRMTGNLSEGLGWTLRPREAMDFGAEFATLSDEGRSGYNRWLSATIKQKASQSRLRGLRRFRSSIRAGFWI